MEPEPWCEAPPVPRTARSVLLYVRTDRRKRWRIAPRIGLQATLFQSSSRLLSSPLRSKKYSSCMMAPIAPAT